MNKFLRGIILLLVFNYSLAKFMDIEDWPELSKNQEEGLWATASALGIACTYYFFLKGSPKKVCSEEKSAANFEEVSEEVQEVNEDIKGKELKENPFVKGKLRKELQFKLAEGGRKPKIYN